jgi:hypothetical protein
MKRKTTTETFFSTQWYPQQTKLPTVVAWKEPVKIKLIDYMIVFLLALVACKLIDLL